MRPRIGGKRFDVNWLRRYWHPPTSAVAGVSVALPLRVPENRQGDELPDDAILNEEDRRGIAAIRADLDREFAAAQVQCKHRQSLPHARTGVRRPRVKLVVACGFLTGCLFGATAVLALHELHRDTGTPRSEPTRRSEPAPSLAPNAVVGTEPVVEVEAALREWIDAAKRRDIPAQMAFYPPRVPVYYTWRDVSHADVRADKVKVFADLDAALIRTGPPVIVAKSDGLVLTRFHKRYVLTGAHGNRRGEVVQELEWARTVDGWKIVSERDVEVVSPTRS